MKSDRVAPDKYSHVRDNDTGRLVPAITLIRRKWEGAKFFMGFQDAFAELARKRLGSEAQTVLFLILGHVEYNNLIKITQAEMARRLGMKKQNVSRAVAKLVEKGVLQVEEQHKKYKRELKLNDEYAWKGKLKHVEKRQKARARKAAKEQRLKRTTDDKR